MEQANLWDREFKGITIDKELTKKEAQRYRMGSVRLALGRIKTREEFEADKKRILSTQLPK
jgi:hypothetical protein